jgi:hypothetical protein
MGKATKIQKILRMFRIDDPDDLNGFDDAVIGWPLVAIRPIH